MNKKLLLSIAFLCATFWMVSAQKMSGRWTLYPTLGRTIDKIIDTGDKVVFQSANDLYHYSESDKETFSYSSAAALSGVEVVNFYFNPDSRQILVIYSDSNLDIIDPDGTVTNVSAIRDANISSTKGIVDVAFKDSKAYLATDFGIVVIDMKKGLIDKSAIWGFGPSLISVAGDRLIVYFGTAHNDKGIAASTTYTIPLNGKITSLNDYTLAFNEAVGEFEELDDNHVIALNGTRWSARVFTINDDGTISNRGLFAAYIPYTFRGADGRVYFVTRVDGTDTYYQLRGYNTETGNCDAGVTIPNGASVSSFSVGKNGYSNVWLGTPDGLGNFDLNSNSVLMSPYFPTGVSVRYPHLMRWGADGRLWVSNLGGGALYSNIGGNYDGVRVEKFVTVIDGDKITDYTPQTRITLDNLGWDYADYYDDLTPEDYGVFMGRLWAHDWLRNIKNSSKTPYIIGGPNHVLPDPDDPELFWISTAMDGIYLCKKNEKPFDWNTNPAGDVLYMYGYINFPYEYAYYNTNGEYAYTRTYNLTLDPEGNMWVAFRHVRTENFGTDRPFNILPASARKSHPSRIKFNEWIPYPGNPNAQLSGNINVEFSKVSDMLFFSSSEYSGPLHAIDTKGTYLNPDDDVYRIFDAVTDQDNNTIDPLYYTAIKEDKTGQVWVCYTEGVYVIQDPNDAKQESLQVRRPIVARNDGTNFGDYLLDGVSVAGMDIDPTNRKWFATFNDGVYLVSADGTKILEHFTTDNSPLVSNVVYSVSCDPNSNKVYIGTDMGLMCFQSDAAPAEPNYSNVYVYPNPVRPEYNGWITIAGLMDDSTVKIADIAGNIVFQGRSSGGSLVWDGCNSAGERVRTGVYLVLASATDENDKASAVVSKIMIMN